MYISAKAFARSEFSSPTGIRWATEAGQTQFTVWAWYVDELVRTEGGWRIAKRFEDQVFVEGGPPAGHEIPK